MAKAKRVQGTLPLPEQKKEAVVIITPYTFKPPHGRINEMPSLTIPDQTMPLEEILRRFVSGQPIPGIQAAIWNGEDEMPDVKHMDLADLEEYQRNVAEQIEINENRLRMYKQEQEAIAAEAAAKAQQASDTSKQGASAASSTAQPSHQ